MSMCAFNSWQLGLWHLYLQIREMHEQWLFLLLKSIWRLFKLNPYHALPLSLWEGRILSGWFLSCSVVCIALLLRSLCSDALNATTPSVARCSIIRTAVNVPKISQFSQYAAFFFVSNGVSSTVSLRAWCIGICIQLFEPDEYGYLCISYINLTDTFRHLKYFFLQLWWDLQHPPAVWPCYFKINVTDFLHFRWDSLCCSSPSVTEDTW